MANNYLQYAFTFPVTKEEEESFLECAKKLEEKTDEFDDQVCFTIEDSEVFIYAEECGDVEKVVTLLQAFLKANPNREVKALGFEWALTCSKSRPGEFGGGCCVVTADKERFYNTAELMMSTLKEFGVP